jgi:UDP-3-O-[3-hydroxymyristoyl] N-acetylglucosamine deacetylase|tara:strand:- start:7086 stop:8006 length:921 start_codon:yes stop_codon:yes gene_type:complete
VSILNQKTIAENIKFSGIGLHTGTICNLRLKPTKSNSGIIFKRIDLEEKNIIFPDVFNVTDANFCTTLSNEFGVKVSTVEHLLAALFILGIDNVLIEVDNSEIPILDGSSKIFIDEIKKIGVKNLDTPIKVVKIDKKIVHRDGDKFISIEPSKLSLTIDFEIKFNNKIIGNQRNKINVYEDNLFDIYNSRTFCLYEDVEKLKRMNLAKGGSLNNAIVVNNEKILNEEGLRNNKEFVNHKILDCIGDLFLIGYKLIGNVKCTQGGHKLTNEILRKVFSNKENYSIIEVKGKNIPFSIKSYKSLKYIA